MSNSPLVEYTQLSPNNSGKRTHIIDTVSIHCVVGQACIEALGARFALSSVGASSNYGVGFDGRIGMYVPEDMVSWCTSSSENDNRAVTIEVASDNFEPFAITQAAYNGLIKLLVDICKRNNIKELKWKGDKSLIGQVDKQNMTVHRWLSNKSCPGQYLYDLHPQIANDVNKQLKEDEYMTREQILAELGDKYITRFDELPEWAKADMRELLDEQIINGGTDYATDPDDINMFLSDIKAVILCKRMMKK